MEGGGVWRKPCLFVRQPDASRPCLPVRTVSGSLPLEQYLTRTKAVWPAPPPLAPGPLSSSPRVAPQELELQCCHHHSTKSDSEGTPCVWEVRAPSQVASLPTSPIWVHRRAPQQPPTALAPEKQDHLLQADEGRWTLALERGGQRLRQRDRYVRAETGGGTETEK